MRNMLLLAILCSYVSIGQQLGDAGWVLDESKYDNRFPEMREYAKAGVKGGIPYRDDTPIMLTLSVNAGDEDMSDDIQQAINQVSTQGGGVVLLNNGIYPIRNKIIMKSGVILRGQNRDNVVLNVFIRYRGARSSIKTETILMKSITNSGLEDFTMDYNVQYKGERMFPLDKDWGFKFWSAWGLRSQNYENERVYHNRENYIYHDVSNLYVDYIWMKESNNCWMDNCKLLNCGSSPVVIGGSNITIRNCHIEGAFYKGGNGNGYVNFRGKYVLITKNTIKKVRHLAIQQGAKYCVVYNNHIEVDVNFHQRDEGHNLVENNRIHIPYFHPWRVFQAGADFHADPGERNMFYDNNCILKSYGAKYTDDNIYTFIGKNVRVLSATPPTSAKLYAIIHNSKIDTDNDGIFNNVDQCNNTPSGGDVNAIGCTQVSSNNFEISSTTPSCPNINNGKISIKNVSSHMFNFVVTGPNSYNKTFENKLANEPFVIENLAVGMYNITAKFSTDGIGKDIPGFQVAVNGATPVSGTNKSVNRLGKSSVFTVSGDKKYSIYVNDVFQRDETFSDESEYDIVVENLSVGKNHIKIIPENICRGLIENWIIIPNGDIKLYPNPTEDLLYIGGLESYDINVQMFTSNGQRVYDKDHKPVNGTVYFSIKDLSAGFYIVKVYGDKSGDIINFKMTKK